MLFDLAHLPYWLLLGAGVLMFLFAISAGAVEDELDFDADGDFIPIEILGWFGLGKIPLLLLMATDLSLWGFLGWMLNTALKLPGQPISTIVFLGSGLGAFILGGFLTRPLGQIFIASFGEDASSDRLVGCLGTVSSATIPKANSRKIGQVDAIDPARNLVTINAVVPHSATVVPQRGQEVLIIDYQPPVYIVVANESIDRDRWLNDRS